MMDDPQPWARLDWYHSQTYQFSMFLYGNESRYGRAPLNDQEGFCFENTDAFQAISGEHCRISKIAGESAAARIKCFSSVNRLLIQRQVNNTFEDFSIGENESVVLSDGDVIGFPDCSANPNWLFRSFQFHYLQNPNEFEQFPIQLTNRFLIGNTFSRGGQGSVKKIYELTTFYGKINCRRYAMKTISKIRDFDQNTQDYRKTLQHIDDEVNVMIRLCGGHINLVNLFVAFSTPAYNFLVMEYCETDLLTHIKKQKPARLNEANAKIVFAQTCNGIRFMHQNRIAHRDIKPENIFLTWRNQNCTPVIKIGDFGFSKSIDDDLATPLGTSNYMPPEIVMRYRNYDLSADIWCLGCLLFVSLSGVYPFTPTGNFTLLQLIANAEIDCNTKHWSHVSSTAKLLVKNMMQKIPEHRPNIATIAQHEWISGDRILLANLDVIYGTNIE